MKQSTSTIIRRFILPLLLILLGGNLGWTRPTTGMNEVEDRIQAWAREGSAQADLAAIRAVLDQQVKAWNQGDLEGFLRGYWQSDQLTFFSGGAKTQGWQATLDHYRQSYKTEGREMGHLEFVDLDIQLLGSKAAFVRGGWELRTSKGPRGGLFTLIWRKTDRGWKIIHDHTDVKNQ